MLFDIVRYAIMVVAAAFLILIFISAVGGGF